MLQSVDSRDLRFNAQQKLLLFTLLQCPQLCSVVTTIYQEKIMDRVLRSAFIKAGGIVFALCMAGSLKATPDTLHILIKQHILFTSLPE